MTTNQPAPVAEQTFADAGGRMTVPVSIAGAGPFRFVVDTGSERTVISHQLASTLGLRRGSDVRVTAVSSRETVGTVVLPSITMGKLGHREIEAPAFEAVNLGAPGLLGLDALKDHALDIDFDRQTMAIRKSHPISVHSSIPREVSISINDADREIVVRARSRFGQLIVTDAYLGRHRIKVVLDTGSSVTMGNIALRTLAAAKPDGQVSVRDVNGATLSADYATVKHVSIGDVDVSQLVVAFADTEPFRRFGLESEPALFLGMDLMRMFRRVSIDFGSHQVRFVLPREAAG